MSKFRRNTTKSFRLCLCLLLVGVLLPQLQLEAGAEVLSELRSELEELRKRDEENRRRIESLERALSERLSEQSLPKVEAEAALDAALDKARQSREPVAAALEAPPNQSSAQIARLLDISLLSQFALGTSTASDEELATLQGGGHDPDKRGFTLQQVELALGAAVDPYLYAEARFVFLEGEGVETEEAFITTTSLPWGLEAELGYFYTEFGLINPIHPHSWDFIDQPLINTRLFGGDGMRGGGVRISKLLPTSWVSELHLGMQQSDGDFMASFRGGSIEHSHGDDHADLHQQSGHETNEDFTRAGIGGYPIVELSTSSFEDFVYLVRLSNFLELSPTVASLWGLSGLIGPNSTGEDGETYIYGTDFLIVWRPEDHFRGFPYVSLQGEVIGRSYKAAQLRDSAGSILLPEKTLHDWGFYSQLLYGFRPRWSLGGRVEWATGSADAVLSRQDDPFRSNRLRLSPLLAYRPTEFSRIRLQYNYDHAEDLPGSDRHSIWLGFDALIGTHPAHKF